jgi:hypothetical protein
MRAALDARFRACEGNRNAGCIHGRASFETAALRPPQDNEVFDGIKKIPHPEEAAKELSRRTHCADPAVQFFHTRFRGHDGKKCG